MSVFFCDSNCELWYTKVDELGIEVISMPYTVDGEERGYDMGRETDFKGFYDKIRKGSIPITSALNSTNYLDIFRPFFEKGEDILYVTFSHKMSATFQYMETAVAELKAEFPDRKFISVDTKSISMGAGLIVYEAAKAFKSGKSIEAVADYTRELVNHTSVFFTVNDLMHLKRGGRLSGTAAIFGTLLGVKPILYISKEGSIVKYATAKGRKKALELIFDEAQKLDIDLDKPVSVITADLSPEELASVTERVKERFPFKGELMVQSVGPVIGTHCGPGTIGLCFMHKKDKTQN
ncbi:MAG: DegV family protein [Clostridiales bacterium]|jgi:DegV family protein with EDD domain|nr:DegV family protein [Clostridiales bacterium]